MTNKKLFKLLELMDEYYDYIYRTDISFGSRDSTYTKMVKEYENNYWALHKYWEFDKTQHYKRDRFSKTSIGENWRKHISYKEKTVNNPYESSDRYMDNIITPPKEMGLYFVGMTSFNPYTNECLYFLKVGCASDINKRMHSYATHNPCTWYLDFLLGADAYYSECLYHSDLNDICIERAHNSHEWFRVSREQYLKACDLGFNFFAKRD